MIQIAQPIISKSKLAELLDADRSNISRWFSKGMPILEDGTVDQNAALEWLAKNQIGEKGGWGVRQKGPTIAAKAEALLREAGAGGRCPQQVIDLVNDRVHAGRKAAVQTMVHPSVMRFLAARVIGAGGDHIAAYGAVETVVAFADVLFEGLKIEVPDSEEWVDEIVARTGIPFNVEEWEQELAKRCGDDDSYPAIEV